jgi:hypothetical protein
MQVMNTVLSSFRLFHNMDEKHVAKELSISLDEYKSLESGHEKINSEAAIKLSKFFKAPSQIFLINGFPNQFSITYSNCHFQNSNGYVNHLSTDKEKGCCEKIIQQLKDDMRQLCKQNDLLIEILKKITNANRRI